MVIVRPEGLVGTTIDGRFRLTELVAASARGWVYRALQQGALDAPCRVKLLIQEASVSEHARARLRREAQILADLDSPHVLRLLDSGTALGGTYVVTEPFEGRLARQLKGRALELPTALRLGRDVAAALHEVHAAGVLHGNLCPDTLGILEVGGETIGKVLDFGLAVVGDVPEQTLRAPVSGVVGYLAPEVVQGQRPTEQADLYSLGVLLFGLATGAHPFGAEDKEPNEVLASQLRPPPRLSTYLSDSPQVRQLERYLAELLSLGPERRPRSASLVYLQLEALRTGKSMAQVLMNGAASNAGTVLREQALLSLSAPPVPSTKANATPPATLTIEPGDIKALAELINTQRTAHGLGRLEGSSEEIVNQCFILWQGSEALS